METYNFNDLFASNFKTQLDGVVKTLELLETKMQSLKNVNINLTGGGTELNKNLETIKELTKTIQDYNKAQITYNKLSSEEVKNATNLEKIKREQIKTENELEKQKQVKLKTTIQQTKEDERKAKQLKKEIDDEIKLTDVLKKEIKTIEDLNKQTAALTKLRNRADIGTREYELLTKRLNENVAAQKRFNEAVGRHQLNVGNYKSALQGVSSALSGIGLNLTGLGAAFAAFQIIKDATAKIIAFEQSIADLQAITGISGENLDYLKKQAIEFSKTSLTSANEAVKAFQLIASANSDLAEAPQALAQVTESAILLSEAAGTDLPDAANRLVLIMNKFGLSASETKSVVDSFAASVKYGTAEIPALTDALQEFGSVAKLANVSINESNALVQTLAKNGKMGSEAGTGLRNVLLQINNAANLDAKAAKSLKDLGVNIKLVSDTTQPLSVRLKEMSKVAGDTSAIVNIFGKENTDTAAILLNNLPLYNKYTEQFKEQGIAQEQAEIRSNTLQGSLKKLQNAYDNMLLSLNEGTSKFSISAAKFVQFLTDIINNGEILTGVLTDNLTIFIKLTDGISSLLNIFNSFGTNISGVTTLFKTFATTLQTALSPVFGLIKYFGDLIGNFKDLANGNITATEAIANFGKSIVNLFIDLFPLTALIKSIGENFGLFNMELEITTQRLPELANQTNEYSKSVKDLAKSMAKAVFESNKFKDSNKIEKSTVDNIKSQTDALKSDLELRKLRAKLIEDARKKEIEDEAIAFEEQKIHYKNQKLHLIEVDKIHKKNQTAINLKYNKMALDNENNFYNSLIEFDYKSAANSIEIAKEEALLLDKTESEKFKTSQNSKLKLLQMENSYYKAKKVLAEKELDEVGGIKDKDERAKKEIEIKSRILDAENNLNKTSIAIRKTASENEIQAFNESMNIRKMQNDLLKDGRQKEIEAEAIRFSEQKQLFSDFSNEYILALERHNQIVNEINNKYADERRAQIVELSTQTINGAKEIYQKINDYQLKEVEARLQTHEQNISNLQNSLSNERQLIDKQIQEGKNYDATRLNLMQSRLNNEYKMRAEAEKKQKDLRKKAVYAQLFADLASSIGSAIVTIMKSGSSVYEKIAQVLVIGGEIATAFTSAFQALNGAPEFAEGGEIEGKSHAAGGVPIVAEGGEYVINKSDTSKSPKLLEMINSGKLNDNNLNEVINNDNVIITNNYNVEKLLKKSNEISENSLNLQKNDYKIYTKENGTIIKEYSNMLIKRIK